MNSKVYVDIRTSLRFGLRLNRLILDIIFKGGSFLGEEVEEKEKINSLKIEKKASKESATVSPDVCDRPSPADPVPVPYPNIAKSSDTSPGSKAVETEGKMLPVKDDFEKNGGDEAGTDDNKSEIEFLEELVKTKVLGISLWIWGLLVAAVVVILWILSLNSQVPIETLE